MTAHALCLTAAITHESEWYVARCLQVEVTSQGETIEESLANLREALELCFEDTPAPEVTDVITARSRYASREPSSGSTAPTSTTLRCGFKAGPLTRTARGRVAGPGRVTISTPASQQPPATLGHTSELADHDNGEQADAAVHQDGWFPVGVRAKVKLLEGRGASRRCDPKLAG
ncbi:MAG TPA: type II toxin-antitoxin system HicB family antitoxin [Micromonosporaceae bacterium]